MTKKKIANKKKKVIMGKDFWKDKQKPLEKANEKEYCLACINKDKCYLGTHHSNWVKGKCPEHSFKRI